MHPRARKLQILRSTAVSNVIFAAAICFLCTAPLARGADFHAPAGQRPAQIAGVGTILPGGRILKPWGAQLETGPSPFGLAVSSDGTVATADIGFERAGLTIVESPGNNRSSKAPWREH